MKRILGILLIVLTLISCSSTRLIESWKNPEHITFNPKRILVIGVTPNLEARKAFEFQLKNELNIRNINALQSTVVFEKYFQNSNQTEAEIEKQINKLLTVEYDTVLVSLVKGVEENESYSGKSSKTDYYLRKYIGNYFVYQDATLEKGYYKKYKIYHIETSIYNLKKESEKSLVWYGIHDIIDPGDASKTIKNYVKSVIKALEKEKLISKN